MDSSCSLSGLELLEQEESPKNKGIVTLCRSVDGLIGEGGIKPGTLTEVHGLPGVGKTCFCLQLCLNVQIPEWMQGLGGQALYVGTNHSISAGRIREMTGAFVKRCNYIIRKTASLSRRPLIKEEDVLEGIHILEVCSIEELSEVLINAEPFLEKMEEEGEGNGGVKLVVIDGIDFPMFTEKDNYNDRVKVLYALGGLLFNYIHKFKVAVVITNSVITRFVGSAFGDQLQEKYVVPYLGEAWGYVPNQVLKFSCIPGEKRRVAELVKSSFVKEGGKATFMIVRDGFRD